MPRPKPTTKIVVADNPAELDQKTRAAEAAPPTSIEVKDYRPGQTIEVQTGMAGAAGAAGADPNLGTARPPPVTDPNADPAVAVGSPDANANPLQSTPESLNRLNELRRDVHAKQRSGVTHPLPTLPTGNLTRYESRIRIAEAWQYTGELASAPAWIDRSWAAWDDGDGSRPQGPALRVPTASSQTGDKLCRRGDYIVRQEVTLALGVDPDLQIEVWAKDEFERFFLPQRLAPPQQLMTGNTPADEEPESADAAQQP